MRSPASRPLFHTRVHVPPRPAWLTFLRYPADPADACQERRRRMGKSKKKKGPSGGRSEPSHVGGAAGSGASVAESHEEAFVVEQRRLLEECQRSRAAAEGRAAEDVIERQRRLLEEASSAVTAAAPGGGGGGGSGGGSGGGGAAAPSSAASAAATAAAVPGAGAAADVGDVFSVRRVKFFGRKVPVLLQNRNGPCALLAATNCLLLRGIMTLRDDERSVAGEDHVSRLAALSRRLNAKGIDEDANVSGAVEKMIERLPGLLEGLLLNCRFGGCKDFECTEDLALFDKFGLPLYHAWVDSDVAKVAASWNALTERLVVCAEIRDNLERERRQPTPDEDARLAEGVWLEDWLEETRAQSTPRGLRELTASVGEREVCVLFRNNHFCTLFKPRSEALCALLTDVSFESMASAVWEQIGLDGCGASTILDADFRAVEAPAAEAAGGASPAGGRPRGGGLAERGGGRRGPPGGRRRRSGADRRPRPRRRRRRRVVVRRLGTIVLRPPNEAHLPILRQGS